MSAERERVAEFGRLENGILQSGDWYRWGPHVRERQWGTVREDYSPDGTVRDYLPHDQPDPAPTAGARTTWPGSATSSSGSAWAWRCGTDAIRVPQPAPDRGERGPQRRQPEYELIDTGVFDGDRYWIVEVHYAKAEPDDFLVLVNAW